MIGAISLEGIIAAMTFTGGTNASVFETYVTQVLVPNRMALRKAISHTQQGIQLLMLESAVMG
jgi:hypothetical protein